jgi:hypothetical protein
MINCALSTETVEKLYKNIFGHMQDAASKGNAFDVNKYIKHIFNGKADKSRPEIAAKIVQHIPRMVIDITNTDFFEVEDFVDLKVLHKLGQAFMNPNKGIQKIISDYTPTTDNKILKSVAETKLEEAFNIEEFDAEEGEFSERFKPYSSLTSTFQEFLAVDPTSKNITDVEQIDESKKIIYTTLSAIKETMNPQQTVADDLIYEGVSIKVKAIPLSSIPQAELDDYTRNLVVKSKSIKKQGTNLEGVTPTDNMVALVISNANGESLYFDSEGHISSKEEGGKLVYQFLRDARKKGDAYTVTDIYGKEDQILDPYEIAVNTYDKAIDGTFTNYYNSIKVSQQEDFKKIYEFKESVLKDKKGVLIPLLGISDGLPESITGSKLMLNKITSLSGVNRSTFKSIKTIQQSRGIFKKGYASIILNGNEFIVDRADVPSEIALQVSQVLTSKDFTFSERMDFYKQFFSNDLQATTRRHETAGKIENKEFWFNYSDETSQEQKQRNFLENSINLSQESVNNKTVDELAADAAAIYDVLMSGKGAKKRYPAKMNFNSDLLKDERYMTYNADTNSIEFKDYIDFIKDLKTEISINSGDPGVFNTYMEFALPSKFLSTVDKVKEELKEDTSSDTKKVKDSIVEVLKESGGVIDADVASVKKGFYKVHYANFKVNVPGVTEEAKVYFHNKTALISVGGKTYQDPTWPKEGNLVRLVLKPELTIPSGEIITNVIEVFAVNEDGTQGAYLGSVAETEYNTKNETPKLEDEVEEQEVIASEEKETIPELEDAVILTSPIKPTSKTSRAASLLNQNIAGLDRSTKLSGEVTVEDVENANNWWNSSPLNKYITLDHAANLVNSDAFARFTVAGATLIDSNILGNISIYQKGSMVDVYHEAWHGFSQLYLTQKEKLKLYNDIREYKDKSGNTPYANKSFFEVEEMIAEDFRTYAKDPKTFKAKVPVQKTIFQKILDFLYKLFGGKINTKDVVVGNYPVSVTEMFDALYLASKDPSLLNKYSPSIDNVMWDLLNRGVEKVNDRDIDVLTKQEANLISNSIDSILSDYVDANHDARVSNGKEVTKSGTLVLLSEEKDADGITNRSKAYGYVKAVLEDKLDELNDELGTITDKSFSEIKTIEDLEGESIAVIRSKSGEDKYIFLNSQVENFNNLTPDMKQGERVKGEKYKGSIEIISDFYKHNNIIINDKNVSIIVVNDVRDAKAQFDNYVKGGAKDFVSIEIKEDGPVYTDLTSDQEDLLDNIRILQNTINNWGDEKSGVMKYHADNSRFDLIREKYIDVNYGDEELDEDGNIIDETDVTDGKDSAGIVDKAVGKKSAEQFAGKETLYIVKSLFKITNGKTVDNKLGFKELVDFNKIWGILLREVGGVKNREVAFNKLKEASVTYAPELKQLVEKKLPDPTKIKHTSEFNVSAAFWQDLSLSDIPYTQLTAFPVKEMLISEDTGYPESTITGFTMEVTDASIEPSNVIRGFQATFKTIQPEDNPYITKVDNITMLTKLNALVKNYEDKHNPGSLNIKGSLGFARSIGVYLDNLDEIKNELETNSEYYGLQYIYQIVKDLADIQAKPFGASADAQKVLRDFVIDPLAVLKSKIPKGVIKSLKGVEVYQKNILDRLAGLQAQFGLETKGKGVFNAAGDMVFPFVQDFSVSRKIDALNSVENLTDCWIKDEFKYMRYLNPTISSFTNYSQILKSVFNYETGKIDEGQKDRRNERSLDLTMVSGTQVAEFNEGTNTSDLDKSSKFLQEMHTMLKGGLQEFIRAAGKKTSIGVRVKGGLIKDKGKDSNLYVDVDMFDSEQTGDIYAANKILMPYIASEFERIQKFKNNREEFKKYTGYNRKVGGTKENPIYAGEVFTAFDKVLKKDTKELLLSEATVKGVNETPGGLTIYLRKNTKLRQAVENDILEYFNEQTSSNLTNLVNNKYIDKSLIEKTNSPNLTEQEQEYMLVKAFTYNSWIHNFETVNLFIGEMSQFNHDKENLHKRNTGAQSGGRKFLTDEWAQNFINDIWSKKSYGAKLAKTLGEDYNQFFYDGTFNTAILKDVERPSIYLDDIEAGLRKDYALSLKGSGKSKEEIQEIIDNNIKKDRKAYEEMNEADGAGYIAIDAYRNLKKLENNWSDKQEALFQDEINGREITAAQIEEFFPVYKLQNYGELANDTLAPVTAMHKFALSPLVPSEIKGSELEHLHKEMMRNNIQYVTFESGSKVGNVTTTGDPDQIFTDNTQTKLKDKLALTKNIIYLEYIKNVTEVNNKFKGKITFPTQLRGLILDGLYEQGALAYDKHAALAKTYHDDVANYTELLKIELLDEIQWEEKNGKYTGEFTKLLSLVQKELSKRDMPEHLVKMIGVNDDGSLKTDLSLHLEADTIEKILLSVINKRLIKQKVKGEAFVQVPSSMYNGLWDTKANLKTATEAEKKKYLGSNNLPFYRPGENGNTDAMKIAIAFQGDFINLLNVKFNGEQIGTLERLNEAIKDDNWLNTGDNRKLITLSGARIPIQNLNSLEFAEVYHFMNPSAGNKIVVPSEIVAKSGSDFDVDKLYFMMPHIDGRGNYVKSSKTNTELSKELASLKGKLVTDKTAPNAKGLIGKQKAALENKIIETTAELLAIPENYASLVRPNDTYLLKPIADKIQQYVTEYNRYNVAHGEAERVNAKDETKRAISPSTTLEIGYNLDKHDKNMTAKAALGIDAQDNKQHPIWNSVGAKMPATYKESDFDDVTNTAVEGEDDYDVRLLVRHNTLINKKGQKVISLSHRYDQDNVRIADTRSHKMNGQLDAEADPWVADVQADLETTPVLNYLMNAGVPSKDAIYFVANPLVREYGLQQKLLKSTFSTIINKAVTEENFVQYKAADAVVTKFIPFGIQAQILSQIANIKIDKFLNKLKNNDTVYVNTSFKQPNWKEISVKELKALLNTDSKLYDKIAGLINKSTHSVYKASRSLITNGNYYYAAKIASEMAGIKPGQSFSTEDMVSIVEKGAIKENQMKSIAMFLHFIEIQKYIKGIGAVMRQANPDTKISKTVQQIKKRDANYEIALASSKSDEDLLKDLKEKSILSSFYLNDLSIDIIEPLFPLRLNKDISQYISDRLTLSKSTIAKKFGKGADGQEKFSSQFNNGVIQYIFQNYMSNFINANGDVVSIPDTYRGMKVVKSKNLTRGIEIVDGQILIDEKTLEKDFKDKLYIKEVEDTNNYAARGLQPFTIADDPFPSQSSYNRYVFEREFLRTKYPSPIAEHSEDITKLIDEALEFATTKHEGQTRAGGKPYIKHPISVANSVRAFKNSKNIDALISAALLHDTLEDTDATYEEIKTLFGGLTASLVKELTTDFDKSDEVGKAKYLSQKMATMSSYALVIKLADRLDNVQDIATAKTPEWRQRYRNETEEILNYIERNRVLSGTHKKIISLIRGKIHQMVPVESSVEKTLLGYERFLNQRSLINVFNAKSIMGTNEYSYTDQVMSIINSFPKLKDKFPVLAQIAPAPYKNKVGENIKVLQLNDKKMAIGELAEIYNQNLKQLADVNIRKVKDIVENQKISDVFKVFSLMMIHQHGVGFSKYGFPKILDEAIYVDVMRNASTNFMANHINAPTLNTIFNKVVSTDQFQNYVAAPADYNNPTAGVYSNDITTEVRNELNKYKDNNEVGKVTELFASLEDIHILRIPKDATNGLYLDNAYNVYAPLSPGNFKEAITMLESMGTDIDAMPDLFYDFANDVEVSISDFYDMIKPQLEGDSITEEVKISMTTGVPLGLKLSIDKKGKDQGKADLVNAVISYPNPNTSSYQYLVDAMNQKVPVNEQIVNGPDVIAMVSVNGNGKATEDQIEYTISHAQEILDAGGTIIMDSTFDATRPWNKTGEALVQEGIGNPTGQTSLGYNYWGPNPEPTTQPSTSVKIEPTQTVISNFYSNLTEKEKEKLGNLDELIDDYVQMYEGTMSEEQYIENVLKCNL